MTRALVAAALAATVLGPLVADARDYAWLGVRIRDLSEQEMDELAVRHGIREGFGVFIVEVMKDTPAARAGMRNGDIVVAIDDRPVTESRVLQRMIGRASPESAARITVLRTGGRQSVPVRLASMPKPVAGDRVAADLGFVLRDPEAPAAGVEDGVAGTPSVAAVLRGSAAERAGLEVGDVLLEVNDRAVITRDAALEALAELPAEHAVRLVLRRGDRKVGVTLPSPGPPG
jgi:serine protease Do